MNLRPTPIISRSSFYNLPASFLVTPIPPVVTVGTPSSPPIPTGFAPRANPVHPVSPITRGGSFNFSGSGGYGGTPIASPVGPARGILSSLFA